MVTVPVEELPHEAFVSVAQLVLSVAPELVLVTVAGAAVLLVVRMFGGGRG